MADVVQYRMERMTEELDDLERRGLFSSAEIADIVRHRRDFEYRLKRPSPLKQDFLLYIDYERRLDALRDLRKRAIIGRLVEEEKATGKKGEKKWKKSVSDLAGVLRILDIYSKAVVRFKGDLDLWFQYLEFCRERRHGRMRQALAQAVRFHPKGPGLWIYAAAWEFDQNLNVTAARALMQSGLRTCPKSEDLWMEYLRMELTYLNKLKARKIACEKVYEEALKILPTTKMFSLYTKFYLDMILANREDPDSVLSNTAFEAEEFTSRILEVYEENAERSGCLTKELAYEYISFYLQIGRIEEARDLAKKLCNGRLSEAADLWTLRISTELKWLTSKTASINDDDLRSISDLFRTALTRLSVSELESLWLMALKFFSTRKKHFEKLVQSLMMELAKASKSDNGYTIAFAVVSWVLQRDGVKRAREMYKR
ncbi:hypothetical protein J5N97_011294 [Dioscorea zingiberensis]|uniref:U3 small nucleolar RNA-associated protein 6 n=1 Tax=Dioscorea zingiberensis TaxID=325984 RepID=A0A9D5D1S2_9LILI|nr:hypothetical protein J5N97_011294 [Dioscorea zingiberensis]